MYNPISHKSPIAQVLFYSLWVLLTVSVVGVVVIGAAALLPIAIILAVFGFVTRW